MTDTPTNPEADAEKTIELVEAITTFTAPGGNSGMRLIHAGDVLKADDPIIEGRENAFRPYNPNVTSDASIRMDPALSDAAMDAEINGTGDGQGDDAGGELVDDEGGELPEIGDLERPTERHGVKRWAEYVASFGLDLFDDLMQLEKAALIERADELEAAAGADDDDENDGAGDDGDENGGQDGAGSSGDAEDSADGA